MSISKKLSQTMGLALLSMALLGVAAVPARADGDDHRDGGHERCDRSVHKAEQNLEKAVHRHGEHSRQAEQRRHQLEELRERCHMGDRDHDRH